jgi:hypothetical protein
MTEIAEPAVEAYPRVAWLRYFIRPIEGNDVAPSYKTFGALQGFTYAIAYRDAVFEPLIAYTTIEAARAALDPLLEAWQIAGLAGTAGLYLISVFQFQFYSAEFLQYAGDPAPAEKRLRAPPMPPSNLTLQWERYPAPFVPYGVDDCVRDLVAHIIASLRSGERSQLLHAYAIATRVEAFHGGQGKAAAALNVSVACLKTMKRLATERGVGASARKYGKNLKHQPLTSAESQWVRDTMLELLRRSSRLAAGGPVGDQFTLSI